MPPKRKPRDWAHPEGLPLEEVDEQETYDGVVTNVSVFGVFVDFGAVKDALLKVPKIIGRGYRRGMEVKGMTVVACEPDTGKVVLEPDPDSLPEPPKRKSSRPPRSRSEPPGAGTRSSSRPRRVRNWDHAEAIPLEELHEGEVYEGVVTNVNTAGVFVDIGAARDARLNIKTKFGKRFRIGDEVKECIVETVDIENNRLSAALADPEEATKDLPPKERPAKPKAKAKGKAKATATPKGKAKAKAQAKAQATPAEGVIPIEDLELGASCDGIVSNRNQYGVFVNIGCGKDAKLLVPKKLAANFRKGDEVYGMKIKRADPETNQIAVTLEEPELSIDGEMEEEQAPPPPRPAKRSASEAPAAKRAASAGAKTAPKAKAAAPKPKPQAPAEDGTAKASKAKSAVIEHPGGMALSRFRPGSKANGLVTAIKLRGVLVNVGAVTDGLLQLPRQIAKQFQVEDEVRGMTVEGLDEAGERLLLSLDDPELEYPDEIPPVPKTGRGGTTKVQEPASKAKAKAKSSTAAASGQAKAKAKPEAAPTSKTPATKAQTKAKAKDYDVGAEVSGVVTKASPTGVFVDIGAVKDGALRLERGEWRNYKAGDQVDVVIDDIDTEAGGISLQPVLMPQEGELEAEEDSPARPQRAQRKGLASKPATVLSPRPASKSGAGAPATGSWKRAVAPAR